MKRYAIAIYKARNNYGAHVLGVDGCIATGDSIEETAANMREALEFHFQGMAEDGEDIPEPAAVVDYVEVDVPQRVKRKAG